jgi:hypothetical protein
MSEVRSRLAICSSCYLPPISYFNNLLETEKVYLDPNERWTKSHLRNRASILSTNGKLNLTVPVQKSKQQQTLVKEIKISYNDPWVRVHKGAIESAYNKSAFFEYLKDELFVIYEKKPVFLIDFNSELTDWIFKKLRLKLKLELLPDERLDAVDYRIGSDQLSPDLTTSILPYPQVFSEKFPFVDGLSILDLLSNKGRL